MRVTVVLGGVEVLCKVPNKGELSIVRRTLPLLAATRLPDDEPSDVEAAVQDFDEERELEIRRQMRELIVLCAKRPKCIDEPRDDEPEGVVNLDEVSDADVIRAWTKLTQAAGVTTEASKQIAPLSETAPPY